MIELFGLVISLLLLITFAYRGASVIVLAPILAAVAVAFSGEVPLLATYTQIFMPAVGQFLARYFPIFLLGAIFGKLMHESGCAQAIANRITSTVGDRHAILGVVLCVAVLTYGGVSLFVVAFAIYPMAVSIFRSADIPRRLIPATIVLGSGTFTMTCLPGTMQIQNLIPMSYFKTTAFAAPVLGIIAGVCILILGMLWLNYRARAAARNSEGYAAAESGRDDFSEISVPTDRPLPSFGLAIAPIICVFVCNYIAAEHWIPSWDTTYLKDDKYGGVAINDVRGTWSSIIALIAGNGLVILGSAHVRRRLNEFLKAGAMDSLLPVFNTATEFGYGTTIASLPAFAAVKTALLNFVPGNLLVSEATAVTVLAGITGSASGGLTIALGSLGETYYQRALEQGISPEVMHRVASIASGGLDSLPHNGAIISLLVICGLTHKQSYLDIGVVSVIIPLIALALIISIASF